MDQTGLSPILNRHPHPTCTPAISFNTPHFQGVRHYKPAMYWCQAPGGLGKRTPPPSPCSRMPCARLGQARTSHPLSFGPAFPSGPGLDTKGSVSSPIRESRDPLFLRSNTASSKIRTLFSLRPDLLPLTPTNYHHDTRLSQPRQLLSHNTMAFSTPCEMPAQRPSQLPPCPGPPPSRPLPPLPNKG